MRSKSKIFEAVWSKQRFQKAKKKTAADEEADCAIYKWLKNVRHSNELIILMVLNSKIEDEVQSGEEDDDYLIGANDNCLEKPTLTAIRSELKES